MSNSQIRKSKTVRVRLPVKSPQTLEKLPHKHIIKVAKKVMQTQIIDNSISKDYILENGNPEDFLKEHKDDLEILGYKKLRESSQKPKIPIPRYYDPQKDRNLISSSNGSKKDLHHRKKVTGRNLFATHFDHDSESDNQDHSKKAFLDSQLHLINNRLTQTKTFYNSKLKSLPTIDKIAYLKQERSLSRFDNITKKWEKIENTLVKKLSRQNKPLMTNRKRSTDKNYNDLQVSWYMTLRQTPEFEKMEKFLPVGNKLSGIYSRNIVSVENCYNSQVGSCPELKVVGCSKLPLEIDALKSDRVMLLKTREEECRNNEEIIAENYDFNNKYLKEF